MSEPTPFQQYDIDIIAELLQIGTEIGSLYGDSERGFNTMEMLIERRTYMYMDALGISAGQVRDHVTQCHIDVNSDAFLPILLDYSRQALIEVRQHYK